MGIVLHGNGLSRRCVDSGGVGNGQGLIIRQDDFKGLLSIGGFHRGTPETRQILPGFAVLHRDGGNVNGQIVSQLIHQGDCIRFGHQVNALLVELNRKGIVAAGNLGLIVLSLLHLGHRQSHAAGCGVDHVIIEISQYDRVVKGLFLSTQQNIFIRQLADDLQLHGVIVSVAAAGNQICNLYNGILTIYIVVVGKGSGIISCRGVVFGDPARTQAVDWGHCGLGCSVLNFWPIPIHPNVGNFHSLRDLLLHPVGSIQRAGIVQVDQPAYIFSRLPLQQICIIICSGFSTGGKCDVLTIGCKHICQFLENGCLAIKGLLCRAVVNPVSFCGGGLQPVFVGNHIPELFGQRIRLCFHQDIQRLILQRDSFRKSDCQRLTIFGIGSIAFRIHHCQLVLQSIQCLVVRQSQASCTCIHTDQRILMDVIACDVRSCGRGILEGKARRQGLAIHLDCPVEGALGIIPSTLGRLIEQGMLLSTKAVIAGNSHLCTGLDPRKGIVFPAIPHPAAEFKLIGYQHRTGSVRLCIIGQAVGVIASVCADFWLDRKAGLVVHLDPEGFGRVFACKIIQCRLICQTGSRRVLINMERIHLHIAHKDHVAAEGILQLGRGQIPIPGLIDQYLILIASLRCNEAWGVIRGRSIGVIDTSACHIHLDVFCLRLSHHLPRPGLAGDLSFNIPSLSRHQNRLIVFINPIDLYAVLDDFCIVARHRKEPRLDHNGVHQRSAFIGFQRPYMVFKGTVRLVTVIFRFVECQVPGRLCGIYCG